jgi:hypothetical protein
LNEDGGYKKTENALGGIRTAEFSGTAEWGNKPSSFRSLVSSGTGGMAVRLGVEGIPGLHNFLEYVAPLVYPHSIEFGYTFMMHPNMAKSLLDYGFKTKASVYQWLYDTYFITVGDFRKMGDWDFLTSGGTRTIPNSNPPITYNAAGHDYNCTLSGIQLQALSRTA